jgi:hypothetical protein
MATTKRTSARSTTAKSTGRRKSTTARRSTRTTRTSETSKEVSCNVPFCPICTVVTTAQHLQPEILGHLMAAARELSMAARTAVDQRGDQVAPPTRLQRIDLA